MLTCRGRQNFVSQSVRIARFDSNLGLLRGDIVRHRSAAIADFRHPETETVPYFAGPILMAGKMGATSIDRLEIIVEYPPVG